MLKTVLLISLFITSLHAQIQGCTDRRAKNFNSNAVINNGSCQYALTKVKVQNTTILSDSIKETSGLIYFDSLFWTHNDDSDSTLYGMDFNGQIHKKVLLTGLKNNDWEEISQDSLYLYIGDFGNNSGGNRQDLKILRIDKTTFFTNNPKIETIAFSYAKQTDFESQKGNTTNFDCEAFVVLEDSIYLFTKEWKSKNTSVYTLSKTPGTYKANYKETLNIKGLITGATLLPNKKGIVLSGYSKLVKPFIYLLYDFKENDFLTGNQRKIKLELPFHQIEGITTQDGFLFYLTNESTVIKPFVNTTQQFHSVDLSDYLKE
jgi:hypothetical protein